MTAEDKKEIEDLLKKSTPQTFEAKLINNKGLFDLVFKALLALLVYYGSQMKSDVETVKDDINTIKVERKYERDEIKAFKDALKEPRYTKDDHALEVTPMRNQISRNSAELNTRMPLIESNTKEIAALKYATSQNAENIREILKILKSR